MQEQEIIQKIDEEVRELPTHLARLEFQIKELGRAIDEKQQKGEPYGNMVARRIACIRHKNLIVTGQPDIK